MFALEQTKPTLEGRTDAKGPQIHQEIFGLIGSAISAGVSAKVASQNRQFQERMTKHRYQYQMEDMRKAGLNPMLAMGSPPPGSPPGAVPNIPDFGKTIVAEKQADANIGLTNANERLASAQAAKAELEADAWGVGQYIFDQAASGAKDAWNMFRQDIGKDWEGTKRDFNAVLDFFRSGAHFGEGNSAKSLERRRDIRNRATQLE